MKSDSLDDVLKAAQKSKTARTLLLGGVMWALKLVGWFGWMLVLAVLLRVCAMPSRTEVGDMTSNATHAADAANAGTMKEEGARKTDVRDLWRELLMVEARRRGLSNDDIERTANRFNDCVLPRFGETPQLPNKCAEQVLRVMPAR